MKQRRIVDEQIIINIPVSTYNMHPHRYKPGILWQELLNTKDVLPTDVISEIGYRMVKENGFGSMKMDDELEDIPVATLVVIRKRQESDDEYYNRMKEENKISEDRVTRDKNEFLRIKAEHPDWR
jgi:hypothetical protein